MTFRTLLIIDDEPQIRRALKRALGTDGVRVLEAATGRDGLDRAATERPDLIILDLGLPDLSGTEVCRELRGWTKAPILVLSARHSDDEKAALLDSGADDYVTKPFSTVELQARVRALLRRAQPAGEDGSGVIAHDGLQIDLIRRSVLVEGTPVHLAPIEWELLKTLATNRGKVLTHQHLFAEVWRGREHGDAQQYLRVHVARLRRKLERDPVRPRHILTEPAVGYRFSE